MIDPIPLSTVRADFAAAAGNAEDYAAAAAAADVPYDAALLLLLRLMLLMMLLLLIILLLLLLLINGVLRQSGIYRRAWNVHCRCDLRRHCGLYDPALATPSGFETSC